MIFFNYKTHVLEVKLSARALAEHVWGLERVRVSKNKSELER